MLDGDFAHKHDEPARRIPERTARCACIALRAGPDLLLHRIVDAFEILGPKELHDLTRLRSRSNARQGRLQCICRNSGSR